MKTLLCMLLAAAPAFAGSITTVSGTWTDASRSREIPYKVYVPVGATGRCPVIIFSHGLGGSRENNAYLGAHWASNGYVSIHIQHPGSDESVWRDKPLADRMKAMQAAAADLKNAVDRPRDVSFTIDQLASLGTNALLRGLMDANRIGVAGHSFGAYTAMAIAGQGESQVAKKFRDPRVKAVIAASTPTPRPVTDDTMSGVRIPVLHLTGTKDTSMIGKPQKPEDRRTPFDHTQNADAYLVVFADGDHMLFSGQRLRANFEKPGDEKNHRLIQAGTLAFWNAYLRDDAKARKWLQDGSYARDLGDAALFEKKIVESGSPAK